MNRGAVPFVVFVATLLVQFPVVQGEFLFYDDARFVVRNEAIEDLSRAPGYFTDLGTTASVDSPTQDIYRPLRTLSYALLTKIAGKNATVFHAASLLVHAATAALLAVLLLDLGLAAVPALVGALAWSLHPATVESTAWVCSLGDLLAGLFAVASVLAHARNRPVLAFLCLLVALLGKESAVVVPGLWLAWDFLLRRYAVRRLAWQRVLPGLGLVLAFLVVRGAVLGAGMGQTELPLGGTHGNAVRTMLAGFGFYVASILFPLGSTVDVRVPVQASVTLPVLAGALLLLGTLFAAFRGPNRTRLAAVWFLFALVPASNVLVPLKIPTADRFLYLPLMALAFGVGEACTRAPRRTLWAAPVALLLLAGLTIHRIGDWRNDASLVAAWGRVNPKSEPLLWAEASQHAQRSLEAMEARNVPAAAQQYAEANRLYQLFVKNQQGAGNVPIQVWMEAGELTYAWAQFMEGIDRTEDAIGAYTASLTWFRMAFERQKAGKGRVVEEEVVRSASMVARIATRLSDMQNPQIDRTIREGMKALQFLGREYGRDITLPFARLLLAASVRIRAAEPDKAREGLNQVLAALDAAEQQGATGLSYWRAQCYYYRAFLQPYDRADVRRAYDLYQKAAEELPEYRYWSYFHAARCRCSEGKVFDDKEAIEEGRAMLDQLEERARNEGVRLPSDLRMRILSERGACGAPG